ncbi:hypothetical protein Pint_06955 [Pistacia integerrima]|uniref:Uncharacterized protein n=1 Tax=Pistacia integerrima TaxID=434235 RepID=A0ACC0XSU6_9ROSI|nr:hypothetical protein Pint_06955 [Pistacia integerrima]
MADVVANQVGGSFGDANDAQRNVFDLGAFVGDLTFEEDASENLRGSPLEAFAGDQSTTRYFIVKMLIAVAVFGSDDTSLEGLEKELEECKNYDVVLLLRGEILPVVSEYLKSKVIQINNTVTKSTNRSYKILEATKRLIIL